MSLADSRSGHQSLPEFAHSLSYRLALPSVKFSLQTGQKKLKLASVASWKVVSDRHNPSCAAFLRLRWITPLGMDG